VFDIQELINQINISRLLPQLAGFIWQGVLALAILIIGWIVISRLSRMFEKKMDGNISGNLLPFLSTMLSATLKVALVISILSTLGLETTSLAALIGALGLAAGMAMSGTLQNIASAVILLFFKPIKVGEFIIVNNGEAMGTVKEIEPFATVLQRPDNTHMYVPNSTMTTSEIRNFSRNETRRMKFSVGISYDADISQAKRIVSKTLKSLDFVLSDPEPIIGASSLGDSSVIISIYYWIEAGDYMRAITEVAEPIKTDLESGGIEIPFPQRDVNLFEKTKFN